MSSLYFDNIKRGFFIKVFLFFLVLLILPIFATYVFIRQSALSNIDRSLAGTINRIKKDIKYRNGKWDIGIYNSDSSSPSPISSGSNPLYIITEEGFVIERSRPIAGFLDSVDFKHLLAYTEVETLTTGTNETWRIISRPIEVKKKVIGVVTVAYFDPNSKLYDEIDLKLNNSLSKIRENIVVNGESLSIKNSSLKDIPYDVSYLVATKFNKIILIKNRLPAYIDVSYVAPELDAGKRFITDESTNEKFLVISKPLKDSKGHPVGVVVAGRSVSNLFLLLQNYLVFSFISRFIVTFPLTVFGIFLLKKEIFAIFKDGQTPVFKKISFDNKKSIIEIDKNVANIPYSSNQYYLCNAVFSSPKKFWETDELLEKFGEDSMSGKSRKIYDAMLAINKKVGLRLIIHKNKTFKFNPEYLSKLV